MQNNFSGSGDGAMKRETRKVIFWVSLFILLVIVVIGGYMYLSQYKPAPASATHTATPEELGKMTDDFSKTITPMSTSSMKSMVDKYSSSTASSSQSESVSQISASTDAYAAQLRSQNK